MTGNSQSQKRRSNTPEAIQRRQRYLPGQMEATRRKLTVLRMEAARLAMPELIEADNAAARRMLEGRE